MVSLRFFQSGSPKKMLPECKHSWLVWKDGAVIYSLPWTNFWVKTFWCMQVDTFGRNLPVVLNKIKRQQLQRVLALPVTSSCFYNVESRISDTSPFCNEFNWLFWSLLNVCGSATVDSTIWTQPILLCLGWKETPKKNEVHLTNTTTFHPAAAVHYNIK